MAFNIWHEVEPGDNVPQKVNMIVEIPKGSRVKYELDKKSGLIMRDRVLYSSVYYPGDYGFIPQTYWEDGDPLDIIVITHEPTFPRTLCEVKVIGVLHMIDDNESDDKIIAVHANDPRCSEWNTIADLPKHFTKEIKHFFETYKDLQEKEVKVLDIKSVEEAHKIIKKALQLYKEKFKGKQ